MNPTFFETPSALRNWFKYHHSSETELWVGIYKKEAGIPSISWAEAVDEGICFGWVEGRIKRIDAQSYAIRLTPRKPKSKWSKKNIEKAKVLLKAGLMEEAGIEAFNRRIEEES